MLLNSIVSNSSSVGGDSWTQSLGKMPLHMNVVAAGADLDTVFSGCLFDRLLEMEMNQYNMQRKPVRLIAAACNNSGIGKDGKVPWNLPCEFQYFMSTITRVSRPGKMNMMVWGKQCWFSHPKTSFPMANMMHVVLSTKLDTVPDHAHFLCQDFESAVRLAAQPPLADLIDTVWVVGGTRVYKDALKHPWCDLVYLTHVMADFDCDVFFPEFDRGLFKLQERFPDVPSGIQEENGIKYKCQVFKREMSDAV